MTDEGKSTACGEVAWSGTPQCNAVEAGRVDRWTHAILRTADDAPSPDEVIRNAAALATLLPKNSGKLWVERVPYGEEGLNRERRRDIELARPLEGTGRWRAILRVYSGGTTDIFVTADRRLLDLFSLKTIAASLMGLSRIPEYAMPTAAVADDQGYERYDDLLGVALRTWHGGSGSLSEAVNKTQIFLPQSTNVDRTAVMAAVAVVLGRMTWSPDIRLALFGALDGRTDGGLRPDPQPAWLTVSVDANSTFSGLTADIRRRLELPNKNQGRQSEAFEHCQAAIILGDVRPSRVSPCNAMEERCCVQPLYPLTIALEYCLLGRARLTLIGDARVITRSLLESSGKAIVRMYTACIASPTVRQSSVTILEDSDIGGATRVGTTIVPLGATWRIDDRIRAIAATSGGRAAVCEGDHVYSYGQLATDATVLARGLVEIGASVDPYVGVALPQSYDLVVSILAVLMAGAAYVPINPASPPERFRHVISDSGVRILVGDPLSLPVQDRVRVVRPSELRALGGASSGPLPTCGTAEDPAYVIYTSGSTGKPKGVVVPHRNVAALMRATAANFTLTPDDRWSAFHSSSFDFSVWEIWGCLTTGACLVLVPFDVSRSPDAFHELLLSHRVSVLSQTPSAFLELLEVDGDRPHLAELRLVIFGGEVLETRWLRRWVSRYTLTKCSLVNMYGITETTVHVTAYTLKPNDIKYDSRAIGAPLPGWHIYICDAYGHPLPSGAIGEMYIGGEGVAIGYLNLPDLTLTRFLPNPHDNGRMYRSGDLGRANSRNGFDHLGRVDHQIKIRGHRVELDEVREVILRQPGVRQCAVIARADERSDRPSKRIDAYVVLTGTGGGGLRERLVATLPDYMLPATITLMDELPINLNGKLDVSGLPFPGADSPCDAATSTLDLKYEPGTALLELVVSSFGEVLARRTHPADSFFDLGGNSLLAIRLVRILRQRCQANVNVADIYRWPTPTAIVSHLAGASLSSTAVEHSRETIRTTEVDDTRCANT